MDKPGKGCGSLGALASGLLRLERSMKYGSSSVGPPDIDDEADQHESDQEEVIK
jgi:hypothetical protein